MNGNLLNKKVQIRVETMAATLLLVVLAALTILLISSTGRTYRYIVQGGSSTQDMRTALFFVTTRVRQSDNRQVNVVNSPYGGNALVITQQVDGKKYEEWIYYADGALREVMILKGGKVLSAASTTICRLSKVDFDQSGSLITVTAYKGQTAGTNLPGESEESISFSLRK